jgi:hypothetical protein
MQWGGRNMQNYHEGSADNNVGYRRRRLLLIGVAVLVIILIFGSILLLGKSPHRSSSFPPADQGRSTVFQGMSYFVDDGLTTEQINSMIGAFSKFSPTAKTVTIAPNSLVPGPHDPSKLSPFTINFSMTIDSVPYSGVASYSDLTSIRVILHNSSGKQVFDSGVISAAE